MRASKTSKTIFRPALALVALSVVSLGLLITLKLTVKAQGSSASSLSPAWLDKDIGAAPRLAGNAQEDATGVYSVTSGSFDIWDVADAFHYVYQPLNGNGQIVARMSGMTGAANEWAKAGLMVRETLDDNSKNAMMLETPGHGPGFQWRSVTGGDSYLTPGSASLTAPYWIKLVRLGNWLAGYSSPDGVNWTLCGWEASDPLPAQVYVGLAVSSHDNQGSSCTALFDQVSVGPVDTSVALSPVAGTGDGLAAAYYSNRHLYGVPVMNRVDAVVNFDLNQNIYDRFPNYPTNQADLEKACSVVIGMPQAEEFSICWSGEIQAQFTEPYTLSLESDDGARVWLNEKLIIDDWAGHWDQEASATVNLTAGQKYLIRIEYYQYLHQAAAKLRWSSPSTPKCLVPQGQLYSHPTDTDGNGLPDIWQMHYFGHLGVDPNGDPDNDGLSNLQEYLRHSEPTNPLTGGVPNEWWNGNIGWQAVGGASYSNGVFAVAGGGYDIWGDADIFHYVFQPLSGNGQIVARISGMTGATNEWAKVGVMIREALDDHARNAMMFDMVGHGLTFQYRPAAGWGHWTEQPGVTNDLSLPYWVKLVRWNNWVGGYRSPDGTNWTLQGWEGFEELAPQVYVGLAVSSHDSQRSSTGLFEHVGVGPANPAEVLSPLIGTGDGLLGNYYADSCLYGPPVTNEVDAQVYLDWTHGEPMGLVNGAAFGVCWSGEIQAQFTEPYTFQLDCKSADWVRVWLNEQLIIDTWEQWHPDGELSSGPINLTVGQRCLLRVEYYNNYGQAVAHLEWSSPSTPKCPVPQSQLYSQPTDTDGNGLPDLWQMHYFGHLGVDPNADPDHDGLSNLQEYLHNTNPTNADTDGDGMPDGWEVAHCLNPTFNDAGEDPEQDGLSNLQKYRLGIDPNAADTGGPDGLPYGLVYDYLGVNPTNLNGLVTEAAVANGSQATNLLGQWQMDGNDIYALSRRGAVEFHLTVSQADKYVLKVIGTQNVPGSLELGFSLVISIDGESTGHRTLNATYGTNGVVDIVTPYLTAGTHTVRVFWDGAADDSSLRIKQVKLLSVADSNANPTISQPRNSRVGAKLSSAAGPNANGKGIKDWVGRMLADESGLDLTNPVISSYTSPVCLEGRDPYLSMMNVNANIGRATNNIPVRRNAGLRWFANVPLSAQGNTVLTVSCQNGGRIEQRRLQWQPVNLLDATNLTIRTGDSLLLTAQPDGSPNSTLSVKVGNQSFAGRTAQPLTYCFTNAGVFTVTGTYAPGSKASRSRSITVTVAGYNFTNSPATWVGYQRVWDLANVPTRVVMQADSRLFFQQMAGLTNNGEEFSLRADLNEPRSIVARLGANGPVLDSVQERGVDLWLDNQTYTKVIQIYPDGSQLIEMLLVESPVLPDLTVELDVIVSGVIFDDGTTTKILTPADFDTLGQAVVRFIRPAYAQTSVCHSVTMWQGPAVLGILR